MKYFWYWHPHEQWPPENVRAPSEFSGGSRLNIVCTQTELPASAQRRIVRSWCELLPTLEGIDYLWLNSRVPQDLFDAACSVPGLRGLYVKWSGIKSIEALERATCLKFLHIGSSTGLQSIEPLVRMTELKWLGLENAKRITSLDPVGTLSSLEGLAVEGGMWATQRVDTLEPVGRLAELKYLSIINLRSRDGTLAPLFALHRLEAFHSAHWWPDGELEELRSRNPGLVSNIQGNVDNP